MKALTQQRLKELVDYCPNSGLMRWKVKRPVDIKPGSVCGTLHADGYVATRIEGVSYLVHRLVFLWMEGQFPPEQVDHINGNRTDNRWCNLRKVTRKQNMMNIKRRLTNKSGVTGVNYSVRQKAWHVRINHDGKRLHLGFFKDFDEAVRVRREAEEKYGYHPNHGRSK